MSPEQVLVRLLIAFGLSLLGLALYWGWNRFQIRRLNRAGGRSLRGLEKFQPGVPGILYFTTPECQVCLTAQKPALQRLDGVQVVEVNAAEQHDLADYWGVLSVPTTFIIDGRGQPRHINHGLAGTEKLRRQVADTQKTSTQTSTEAQTSVAKQVPARPE